MISNDIVWLIFANYFLSFEQHQDFLHSRQYSCHCDSRSVPAFSIQEIKIVVRDLEQKAREILTGIQAVHQPDGIKQCKLDSHQCYVVETFTS